MNRRDFLKSLVAGFGVVVGGGLVLKTVGQKKQFNMSMSAQIAEWFRLVGTGEMHEVNACLRMARVKTDCLYIGNAKLFNVSCGQAMSNITWDDEKNDCYKGFKKCSNVLIDGDGDDAKWKRTRRKNGIKAADDKPTQKDIDDAMNRMRAMNWV